MRLDNVEFPEWGLHVDDRNGSGRDGGRRKARGFARGEIDAANSFCCGAMTLEAHPI